MTGLEAVSKYHCFKASCYFHVCYSYCLPRAGARHVCILCTQLEDQSSIFLIPDRGRERQKQILRERRIDKQIDKSAEGRTEAERRTGSLARAETQEYIIRKRTTKEKGVKTAIPEK